MSTVKFQSITVSLVSAFIVAALFVGAAVQPAVSFA